MPYPEDILNRYPGESGKLLKTNWISIWFPEVETHKALDGLRLAVTLSGIENIKGYSRNSSLPAQAGKFNDRSINTMEKQYASFFRLL